MLSSMLSSTMMSSTMFMVGGTSALGSIALILYLLLHEIIFTGKVDQDIKTLQSYIKNHLKKGIEFKKIRTKLMQAGWPQQTIDKTFQSIILEEKIQELREKDYSYKKIKQLALKSNWPEDVLNFIIMKQHEEMKHVFTPAIVALTLVFISVVVIKVIEVLA